MTRKTTSRAAVVANDPFDMRHRFGRRAFSLVKAALTVDDFTFPIRVIGIWLGRSALVLLSVAAVSAAAFYLPPLVADWRSPDIELTSTDYVTLLTQTRQSVLIALGGLIAGIGLIYTHRRHQLDRDANRTDRYAKAVEQLGNDSVHVRLGGVFSLERIAADSVRDRPTIVSVLSAFVRERSPARPIVEQDPALPVATDVNAAMLVLGRRKYLSNRTRADVTKANLFESDLHRLDLAGLTRERLGF